jgi:predicted double-glycine peptidase
MQDLSNAIPSKKITTIKQWDEDSCGPASIEMVAKYFESAHTRESIIESSKYKERDGMTNVQLVETLNELGYKTAIKNSVSWDELQKLNTPDVVIVVSWMLNGYIGHFSVIDDVTETHISLAEPEAGNIVQLEKIVFMRLWMDYDEKWYPEVNTDIQLRWLCAVEKGSN